MIRRKEEKKKRRKEEKKKRRKDGNIFSITPMLKTKKSPFDIKGIKTKATTTDIFNDNRYFKCCT